MVYDKPIVTTQRFSVSIPNNPGRITVIRKQIERQAHNTACDIADCHIDYEVYQDVSRDDWQTAVNAIESEIEKNNQKKLNNNKK